MSEKLSTGDRPAQAVMLSFRDRFTTSPQFAGLFREGMDLVEKTAEYLDRQGREEARRLVPPASLLYTSESMKLTTRLMQLASWLLLKRAVANGEIPEPGTQDRRRRTHLAAQSYLQPEGFAALPEAFQGLILHSYRLHDRVVRLDRLMSGLPSGGTDAGPPLPSQIERIRLAFPAA